jgi:hypothetical protein
VWGSRAEGGREGGDKLGQEEGNTTQQGRRERDGTREKKNEKICSANRRRRAGGMTLSPSPRAGIRGGCQRGSWLEAGRADKRGEGSAVFSGGAALLGTTTVDAYDFFFPGGEGRKRLLRV